MEIQPTSFLIHDNCKFNPWILYDEYMLPNLHKLKNIRYILVNTPEKLQNLETIIKDMFIYIIYLFLIDISLKFLIVIEQIYIYIKNCCFQKNNP